MIRIQALANNVAEILIYDQIGESFFGDGVTASKVDADLKALGDVAEIVVRIDSPGGSVSDGVAIYNMLRAHKAKVTVKVEGWAASSASLIAMAGDEIQMGVGTQIMIHNPFTFAGGNANDMRQIATALDSIREGMVDAYEARTGEKRADIIAAMDAETWMSPAVAIEKGYADSMIAFPEKSGATTDAKQRLVAFASAFKNVPTDLFSPQAIAVSPPSAAADSLPIEVHMTPEEIAARAAEVKAAEQAAARAALVADSARRTDIRNVFGRFATDHAALLTECQDDTACTADAASKKLLAKLGEGAAPIAGNVTIVPGADGRDKFVAGASRALMARAGVEKQEAGNEYNGLTLVGFAAACLVRAGISVKGMSPDQLARKVLATHSSSDFPILLSNTAGKILRDAYAVVAPTYKKWCSTRPVSDFKQIQNIAMGSFNSLATIPEGGEYKEGTFSESKETNIATTKGRLLRMTRQMLVNDDLGGFSRRAQMLGTAAGRTVNADAYAVLTANAATSDTGLLFNSTVLTTAGGHANLAGTPAAISVTALSIAKAAMRLQKNGVDFLNIAPKTLLVPVTKEDLAREVITSTTKDAQSNSAQPNVLRNFVEVVSDPVLDANSTTSWYLAADPAIIELVQAVFLDGNETPFVDEEVEFMTDALAMKIRLDYGFAAVDFRAGFKNAGA